MAKRTNNVVYAQVQGKLEEIASRLDELKASESLSKNTVKTQTQIMKTRFNYLFVIRELVKRVEDINTVDAEALKVLDNLCVLTETRKMGGIEVKEGDTIIGLIQQYKDKSYDQILKAIERAGLKVNGNNVVKA